MPRASWLPTPLTVSPSDSQVAQACIEIDFPIGKVVLNVLYTRVGLELFSQLVSGIFTRAGWPVKKISISLPGGLTLDSWYLAVNTVGKGKIAFPRVYKLVVANFAGIGGRRSSNSDRVKSSLFRRNTACINKSCSSLSWSLVFHSASSMALPKSRTFSGGVPAANFTLPSMIWLSLWEKFKSYVSLFNRVDRDNKYR